MTSKKFECLVIILMAIVLLAFAVRGWQSLIEGPTP